jgi:hypothetical protein
MTFFTQMVRAPAAVLIGAITVASIAAPAQASGKTGAELLVRQACQSVIRVQPGESYFEGCVSSLADSLESASRARAVAQARDVCFALGLKPRSADLSLCLLKAADTKPGPDAELPDTASMAIGVADDPQSSKSYFAVSSDTKIHREQEACARLGFDPAYAAFANCVANLQSTLQGIDMSGG